MAAIQGLLLVFLLLLLLLLLFFGGEYKIYMFFFRPTHLTLPVFNVGML